MVELPSGTVTFLFTDIEGSTRLLHELGDAYADALAEHRHVVREAFARHGGVEVDTQGDAFFVAFARASDALAAAREATAALAGPVRVRMGVHTGEPQLTSSGYVGLDVHRAARIAAAGHGGQILVSRSTRDLAGANGLRDLGEHRLKDLTAPERIYQLGDADFPPLKTLHQTNLPVPATPFVGRERELQEVTELLAREDVRLVTLTGPGGTGKTRLALHAVAAAADTYKGGVWWVPLGPVVDPALVLPAASQTIGGGADLAAHVGDRPILLLLDNFEHVVDAADDLAEALARCPRLDVVVTSRVPLQLAAEWNYAVDPLARSDSAELFLQRARAARRDFAANGAVEEICARLDHLPLAIELAAARGKLLDAPDLLRRLDRRLPILKGGPRDAPERQRTLRSTIEWSYDLLTGDEPRLFARLGVFAGGFTLEAADAVCDAGLDDVEALVQHSLVRRWGGGRLGMLETIHEYANERLNGDEDAEDIRRRHALHYLDVARAANLSLASLGKPQRHELVLPDQHNLRAAVDWATEHDVELGLRLVLALENFWITQDPGEGAWRFAALLDRSDTVDPRLLAEAWRDYGGALEMSGRPDEAESAYVESGRLFQEAGDERGIAEAEFRQAIVFVTRGERERALELLEKSLAVFERRGDPTGSLQVLSPLALLAFEGDFERGRQITERSIATARELGWAWWEISGMAGLAERILLAGETDDAERRAREVLERATAISDRWSTTRGLTVLARVFLERGETEPAAALWAAVEAEAARAPIPRWDTSRARHAAAFAGLPAPEHVPTLDEAVALALGATR